MDIKRIFVPLTLESIEPLIFPDVALYIKTGGNFVLYKSSGHDFTHHDHARRIFALFWSLNRVFCISARDIKKVRNRESRS